MGLFDSLFSTSGIDTNTSAVVFGDPSGVDSGGASILYPGGTYTPGSDTTPVPTSDPYSSDPFAILKQVGSVVSQGVNAYTGFLTARDSISNNIATRNLNQLKTQAQIQLANQQINSQATTDQARIAAQTAIANRTFAQMPGITSLFGGTTAPGKSDYLMLGLTALGVYFAWRAVSHA